MTVPMKGNFFEESADEQRRLEACYQKAVVRSVKIDEKTEQVSIDIGKEKTQYFEKLTFGCGATVALIVSFVGAHTGKLQPPFLLRSALVTLVLAMICGFYRNWKFPWYFFAHWARRSLVARRDKELAKKAMIATGRAIGADEKPIDPQSWFQGFSKTEAILLDDIGKAEKTEDSAFKWTRRAEYTMLILAGLGMIQLVILACLNF